MDHDLFKFEQLLEISQPDKVMFCQRLRVLLEKLLKV
jgi:hypothetical protein